MRQSVAAPPAQPPRFGIVAAAPVINDQARWQAGVSFEPEQCGQSGRIGYLNCGPTSEVDPDRGPGTVNADPFAVWASDRCTAMGGVGRDWQGRARRQLEATRSYQIANELWEGTLAVADSLDNRALVDLDSDVLTAGAVSVQDALGCVEQGIADCSEGRRGMVHVRPQVLTHMALNNMVTLQGNTWVTPNGHIVVPDAGYTGNGPAGQPATVSSQWIYGTGIIALRLGEVTVTPGSLDDARTFAQQGAFDHTNNDVLVVAYQPVLIEWDLCCHVAAEVNIGLCLAGGVS